MHPETSLFQAAEPGAEGEAPPEMPEGMMGGEGQQIPPEILRQLQQQMGAHGGSPH